MEKSKSKSEDKSREQESRVNKTHGGNVVESVSKDDLTSFNDATCKHKVVVPDDDPLATNTYVCENPDCNEVFLFDEVKV
jgi:hypothetical protein